MNEAKERDASRKAGGWELKLVRGPSHNIRDVVLEKGKAAIRMSDYVPVPVELDGGRISVTEEGGQVVLRLYGGSDREAYRLVLRWEPEFEGRGAWINRSVERHRLGSNGAPDSKERTPVSPNEVKGWELKFDRTTSGTIRDVILERQKQKIRMSFHHPVPADLDSSSATLSAENGQIVLRLGGGDGGETYVLTLRWDLMNDGSWILTSWRRDHV